MISFIDIEASGFPPQGYAIEVAWNDQNENIHSFLINPYHFTDKKFEYWSMDSQQIHGISREQLRNDGVDPYWLVEYLNATVPDVVYSDAVLYDQWWIDRIYKACCIERKFKIETTDRLWFEICENHDRFEILDNIYKKVEKTFPHTHRASDDVKCLLEVYKEYLKLKL